MNQTLFVALKGLEEIYEKRKSKLNTWERGFVADTIKRFKEYGGRSFFTWKQEERVFKIYNKYKGGKK